MMMPLLLLMACAWMNDATAAGILGGETTQSGCVFSHASDQLRIEVFAPAQPFRSYVNRCKSRPETLKAIGNEAVLCDGTGSEQLAIGRVRDQVFVLELKAGLAKTALREKLKSAAEIVAGNLF